MYLEVTPKGSKRWRLRYRFDGKEKTISLGVYPEVSLKLARQRRSENRQLLATGVNPSEQRKAAKAAKADAAQNSFEAIAREWHAKQAPNWADTYSGRVLSRLSRDIFPWVGANPIEDITAPELLKAIRCVFHAIPVTHSMASRSLIPCDPGHRFHAIPVSFRLV